MADQEDFAKVEATAEAREIAAKMRDLYVALRNEGFTDRQAQGLAYSVVTEYLFPDVEDDEDED